MVVYLFYFGKTEKTFFHGIKETCEGLNVMPFPDPMIILPSLSYFVSQVLVVLYYRNSFWCLECAMR